MGLNLLVRPGMSLGQNYPLCCIIQSPMCNAFFILVIRIIETIVISQYIRFGNISAVPGLNLVSLLFVS